MLPKGCWPSTPSLRHASRPSVSTPVWASETKTSLSAAAMAGTVAGVQLRVRLDADVLLRGVERGGVAVEWTWLLIVSRAFSPARRTSPALYLPLETDWNWASETLTLARLTGGRGLAELRMKS